MRLRLYIPLLSLTVFRGSQSYGLQSSSRFLFKISPLTMQSNLHSSLLLISTSTDIASSNIASRLLLRESTWNKIELIRPPDIDYVDNSTAYSTTDAEGRYIFLWCLHTSMLNLNKVDQVFTSHYDLKNSLIKEAIFLSKHVAASGQRSLTVHPIGIPWQSESTRSGGVPGKCSPPSPRIAALYRLLLQECKSRNLTEEFQVTMEVTHHGPYMEVPSCFVEIGSCEIDWGLPHAGTLWADCLCSHLGIRDKPVSNSIEEESVVQDSSIIPLERWKFDHPSHGVVCLGIGGGHYSPKLNDLARLGDGLYTGHALATYAFHGCFPNNNNNNNNNDMVSMQDIVTVEGGWKAIIMESISSTNIALPDCTLICLVDKKAFSSSERIAITSYLDECSIQWTFKTGDVKNLWQTIRSNFGN